MQISELFRQRRFCRWVRFVQVDAGLRQADWLSGALSRCVYMGATKSSVFNALVPVEGHLTGFPSPECRPISTDSADCRRMTRCSTVDPLSRRQRHLTSRPVEYLWPPAAIDWKPTGRLDDVRLTASAFVLALLPTGGIRRLSISGFQLGH